MFKRWLEDVLKFLRKQFYHEHRAELFKNSVPVSVVLPVFQKPRHRCPFYGFRPVYGLFTEPDGGVSNLCGLIKAPPTVCKMEKNKQVPNWDTCPLNTKYNRDMLVEIRKTWNVSPREFIPEGAREWSGISFAEWEAYIMANTTPRPKEEKERD